MLLLLNQNLIQVLLISHIPEPDKRETQQSKIALKRMYNLELSQISISLNRSAAIPPCGTHTYRSVPLHRVFAPEI